MIRYLRIQDTIIVGAEPEAWIELTGYTVAEVDDIIIATKAIMIGTQKLYDHNCGHDEDSRCSQVEVP